MRPLMNEQKQKMLSTLIVSLGAFLGFQAINYITGLYQLRTAIFVSFYVYAFHVFWLTFLFDLHLKKRGVLANAKLNARGFNMLWCAFKDRCAHVRKWEYLRHYQNYQVLPGLIYWASVILIFLNPFNNLLKELIVVSSTFALSIAYWYMKEHVSRNLEHQDHWIRVLSLVKLFAAFLIYSAVIGTTIHYGFDPIFLLSAVLTLTFLLVYHSLFHSRLLNFLSFLLFFI